MLLCSRAGGCENELMCESLYVCTVQAHKGFVRCEPTRALYDVLVLAHQGFVQCASVFVRERVQMSLCVRTCTSVRTGGCADSHVRDPVRLYDASLQGVYAMCF